MSRHALLGGSFDPFHNGHRWLVEAALALPDCGHVWVVPAARPPHKPGGEQTAFAHRLAMAQAGVAGLAGVSVSGCEAERDGPSYTFDTLRHLTVVSLAELPWYLVLGADMAADFPTWHNPEGILEAATLVVAERAGGPPIPDGLDGLRLPGSAPEVSATEIRARVAAGDPIGHLVPEPVAAYIAEHRLYR